MATTNLTLVTDEELLRGLVVAAAHVSGCERVLTEDLAAGAVIGGVRVESPFG